MIGLIIAVALTTFLGVVLLVLLLGGKSAVSSRLAEVATVGATVDVAEGERGPNQVVGKVLGIVAPIRKMLGMTADADVTRRLALAGFREPVHTDIYYGVKLLAPVAGGCIAAFFIKESTIFWFFALGCLGFFRRC